MSGSLSLSDRSEILKLLSDNGWPSPEWTSGDNRVWARIGDGIAVFVFDADEVQLDLHATDCAYLSLGQGWIRVKEGRTDGRSSAGTADAMTQFKNLERQFRRLFPAVLSDQAHDSIAKVIQAAPGQWVNGHKTAGASSRSSTMSYSS